MDFDRDAFLTALHKTFGMDPEDATNVCAVIEDCFFGEDEVNDEDLDKETRSLFYTLEAEGLMTFRRTEYKFEGAVRRAFFWRLSQEVVDGTIAKQHEHRQTSEEEEIHDLYATLAADVWARDGVPA